MLLIRSFIATFAAGIILAASVLAFAQTRTTAGLKTGYAPVNGLNLYYEIHGTGEPLILLHGGLAATEIFSDIMPSLSKNRQVNGHVRLEGVVDNEADKNVAGIRAEGVPGIF